MPIEIFQDWIKAKVVDQNLLFDLGNKQWEEGVALLDPMLLPNAYTYTSGAQDVIFHGFEGYPIYSRPAKNHVRIMKKLHDAQTTVRDESKPYTLQKYMKVMCDWIAFRVDVPFENIETVLKSIEKNVKGVGGVFARQRPNMDTKTDIVSFAYVYIPEYKYIIEVQVGHPFARVAFTWNSIRHGKGAKDLVDAPNLFDTGVYDKVKAMILASKPPSDEEFTALVEQGKIGEAYVAEFRDAVYDEWQHLFPDIGQEVKCYVKN